jgi:hypothetical protein
LRADVTLDSFVFETFVSLVSFSRLLLGVLAQPEVQSYLARILSLYSRIVDESLFVAEQAELGEEYDEDDQDLVSQLQYCVLDMLHVWFQDLHEAATDPIARGVPDKHHPFNQANFVKLILDDEDCVDAIREIVQVLMENTKKPSPCTTTATALLE